MAVTRLDAAASGNTDGASYTISAGSDRLLVIGHQVENDATPGDVTVTWGGQSLIKQVIVTIGGANTLTIILFTLDEAGIAAASGSTITFGGEQPGAFTWHAASYAGVDQTTPIPETNSDGIDDTTPNPLTGADIVAGDGAAVVALGGCGNATTALSTSGDLTEQTDEQDVAGSSTGSYADGLFASGQTVDVEFTWASQNRAAVASMELAPVAAAAVSNPWHVYAQQ